jgi:hypothetical protein
MTKRNFVQCIVFLVIFTSASVFAENTKFSFGNVFFSVSPRILENGSITDIVLGYRYTEKDAGELHLRFSREDKNEEFDIDGVTDSLNALSENNFEIFLLPFEHAFIRSRTAELSAGVGIYYNYNKLTEKGYFNMPALETAGRERVNSYSNDFSMHSFGPVVDIGFFTKAAFLEISGNAGIVPIFWFFAKQKMGITPLLDPHYADFSQQNYGSPYLYTDINFIIYKYFSIGFLYNFSRLEYQVIDFDDDLKWRYPSQTVFTNSLKLEASFLIPIADSVFGKIGFGYSWGAIQLDTDQPIWNRQYYFIFNTSIKQKRGE